MFGNIESNIGRHTPFVSIEGIKTDLVFFFSFSLIGPNKHRRVVVVYYLCRNDQLEHPHFVEVSLPGGLYQELQDDMASKLLF
ncbi:hypothetical protein HanRHA438_Chr09g0401201 [Helianthus annuus]|nr:hypothetical protein HanIR_Chr09g0420171 [Helianthus annuus]KAJ0888360.1 hypothetical protein HanRHA438_Chr09g0401201 [Helianthus annuus]